MEPHHTIDRGKQNSESNTHTRTQLRSKDFGLLITIMNVISRQIYLPRSPPTKIMWTMRSLSPFPPLRPSSSYPSSLWKGKGGALIRYSPYAPSVGTCIISIIPLSQMGQGQGERQMTNRCIFLEGSIICDTSPLLGDLFDFIFWQPNLTSCT